MFSFKNAAHALATYFKSAKADAVKVEHGIENVEAHKTVIEGVSAAVAGAVAPGSAVAVLTIEDAAFAVLGAVDAALKSGDAATEQKLLDAGLDKAAIDAAKNVGTQTVAVYKLAQAATK